MDIMGAKRLSDRYKSCSGATFCLVEMQVGGALVLGISKATLEENAHLKIEMNRACDATYAEDRAEVIALFDRFVRFYKDHWVEVVE